MSAVVLFDLDGTISDSAPGILTALRHAFEVNGIPPLDAATERAILGPPFYTSLPPYIGGTEHLDDVIAAYRERYVGGGAMYDTRAYDGMPELLRTLAASGVRLALATSKPEAYAVPIVEHLGVADCFETIGGDRLDGSLGTKALVVGEVLRRLGDPDPATVRMVGDREHDALGARAHGVDTIGVSWGYGLPGELAGAGVLTLCDTAAELAGALSVTPVRSRSA